MMILIYLIPNQYKIIRYNGFYRKKHKLHDTIIVLIDKAKRAISVKESWIIATNGIQKEQLKIMVIVSDGLKTYLRIKNLMVFT